MTLRVDRAFEKFASAAGRILFRFEEGAARAGLLVWRAFGVAERCTETQLLVIELIRVGAELDGATFAAACEIEGPGAAEAHRDAEQTAPRQDWFDFRVHLASSGQKSIVSPMTTSAASARPKRTRQGGANGSL